VDAITPSPLQAHSDSPRARKASATLSGEGRPARVSAGEGVSAEPGSRVPTVPRSISFCAHRRVDFADAIGVDGAWRDHPTRLVDTAGLRRRPRVEGKPEELSVADALRANRFAETVMMLLDDLQPFERQD
jgi:hypothetical protein